MSSCARGSTQGSAVGLHSCAMGFKAQRCSKVKLLVTVVATRQEKITTLRPCGFSFVIAGMTQCVDPLVARCAERLAEYILMSKDGRVRVADFGLAAARTRRTDE